MFVYGRNMLVPLTFCCGEKIIECQFTENAALFSVNDDINSSTVMYVAAVLELKQMSEPTGFQSSINFNIFLREHKL